MKYYIVKLYCSMLLLFVPYTHLYALTDDVLLKVHNVTTTEMNAIVNPVTGSLVYNITEHSLYVYAGTLWKKVRASGSNTVIQAGSSITISGNGTTSTPYIIGKP